MVKIYKMELDSDWADIFNKIKSAHDAAYKTIERAISLEEIEKPLEALEKYKEGIELIDHALNIRVSYPGTENPKWEEACSIIHKLKRTRAEVLSRINCLKAKHETVSVNSASSSRRSTDENPKTYSDLALDLRNVSVTDFGNTNECIIYINNEAKLYYISPDGTVLSTLDYQELKIFGIEGDVPNIFLQIGNWIYPLVPGVSPFYKTEYNGFIFPDIHSTVQGSSVGIIVPGDADEFLHELLTNILQGVIQHEDAAPTVTEKISSGLVTGAGYVARGLVLGAENIGRLLNYGTPKIINNMNPARESTSLPSAVSQGIKFTETATNKTAEVTGYMADKIGLATSKLGQFLAPHIQKQGTRILQTGFNYSEEEASSKVKGALTIAAGAVEGVSTVYHGLEQSAGILGHNLRDNTVKIVKHKYGSPVGEVTMDTLNTVGNVVTISHNAGVIKPKNLIKKTATGALAKDNK